jgi:phosphoglycolate phosphatase-like HAD superfamily hydrolase
VTTGPGVLALDFDGVLCDGMAEYFESSRRACARVWPESGMPGRDLFAGFRELRPVIKTGWEMPVLLRALGSGLPTPRLHADWEAARDELLARDPRGHDLLGKLLEQTLDRVRREWIETDRAGWLAQNKLYSDVADVRRLVRAPERAAVVTTKEGQFCRWLLDHWGIGVADIQGKEAGTHKCDNLRALRAKYEAETGKKLTVWFVEDRLKTLQCVRTHADLEDVGLFLAAWGYVTEATRAEARSAPGIKVLRLAEFTGPFADWGAGG